MKELVIGLGKSGKGAVSFLVSKGYDVIGFDDHLSSINICDVQHLGKKAFFTDKITEIKKREIQRIILSPGIPISHPLVKFFSEKDVRIVSEIELGFEYLTIPCIAITGTNGKTTTALLTSHVLNKNGIKSAVFGNNGVALTSYFLQNQKLDVIVLELSSFQLEKMTKKKLMGASLVNISSDHQNRYSGMAEYIQAKANIIQCLKKGSYLFTSEDVIQKYGKFFDAAKIQLWNKKECFVNKESWHQDNIWASYSLCSLFGISKKEFSASMETFQKPSHRLEFISCIKGVSFYNDSKATNVEAVSHAVEALMGPIVLIAGGDEKFLDYSSWAKVFEKRVIYLVLIGKCMPSIAKVMQKDYKIKKIHVFKEAVKEAYHYARNHGALVLLSPGSSSYDMFQNYEHRGHVFKQIIRCLEKEECDET